MIIAQNQDRPAAIRQVLEVAWKPCYYYILICPFEVEIIDYH